MTEQDTPRTVIRFKERPTGLAQIEMLYDAMLTLDTPEAHVWQRGSEYAATLEGPKAWHQWLASKPAEHIIALAMDFHRRTDK